MSLKAVSTHFYPFPDGKDFILSEFNLEKACVVNESLDKHLFHIVWIREGSARYSVDFRSFEVGDETVFFLNPGQVFSVESEKVKTGYLISFSPDFHCVDTHSKSISCNGLLFRNIYELPYIRPNAKSSETFSRIVKDMKEEIGDRQEAYGDMLKSYLRQFLVVATRLKKTAEQGNSSPEEESEHVLARKFSELVEKHFRQAHSVAEYADMLDIAPKTLSKKLALLGKKSPLALIRERIILESKRMFVYTDMSVKEIAYDLGFQDPAYFTRFFRKAEGKSPQEFKKLMPLHVGANYAKP
ncbi:AraC family transcriptional regulator [Fulvitalea axinellae]|uniref:AraC family transcriptional regulator n=1 Tax=Fulvitalea axinellae TaxID=1182444 RepID=A0AAU9CN43_9BACT|nr:AraC family transcriptional regulator [Fulvitalea axinellae]